MPIPREVFPFTARLIGGAPDQVGIFVLWKGEELIYLGATAVGATIRSRLLEHFSGRAGDCTRVATHYSWQISPKPAELELELLVEYRQSFQRLPR